MARSTLALAGHVITGHHIASAEMQVQDTLLQYRTSHGIALRTIPRRFAPCCWSSVTMRHLSTGFCLIHLYRVRYQYQAPHGRRVGTQKITSQY
eukprot:1822511-Rhodomonas_salina.1